MQGIIVCSTPFMYSNYSPPACIEVFLLCMYVFIAGCYVVTRYIIYELQTEQVSSYSTQVMNLENQHKILIGLFT